MAKRGRQALCPTKVRHIADADPTAVFAPQGRKNQHRVCRGERVRQIWGERSLGGEQRKKIAGGPGKTCPQKSGCVSSLSGRRQEIFRPGLRTLQT